MYIKKAKGIMQIDQYKNQVAKEKAMFIRDAAVVSPTNVNAVCA